MTYKIEKGVPIPCAGIRTKYPLAQMEVGDSFIASVSRGAVYAAASRYGVATGTTFKVSAMGGKVRCWRIA